MVSNFVVDFVVNDHGKKFEIRKLKIKIEAILLTTQFMFLTIKYFVSRLVI